MEGEESPQSDKAACSSIVWVLAGWMDILVVLLLGETNLTRKLKIYYPKIHSSRKAAVGLAMRTRSRHWFVTLVFL